MERAGNGASGKRCDIDGVTRTGELAGVSESSRDIDGQTREGERAGENESIELKRLGGLRQWSSRERTTWTGSPKGEQMGICEWSRWEPRDIDPKAES